METEIGHIGYTLKLSTLPSHFLENIRQELYVKPLENPNFPTNESAYPVFRISKSKIYIPRFYGIEKYGQPLKNTLPPGETIDLEFVGTIRPIQQETIDATLKIGSGLISLDTGLGKTVVALKLISLIKVKTLIFVHADFLLDQWIERIKQYLPSARIGVVKQDKCEIENVDITICMIQTFTKREYPKDTFKSYVQMIIDECFPGRQLISTFQGPMKIKLLYNKWNNKEILPLVLSFNELTQQLEYKKITHAWKKQNENLLKISYSNNNNIDSIECTENHKILTLQDYVEARKLNIGDLIKCNYGFVIITSIEKIKNKKINVYDIEVEDNHNFICCAISGIGPIVHNCHHLGSKTFSSIFFKVQTKLMIGLSATPERKDGLSKVIYWFLGPHIIHIKRDTDKPKIKFIFNDTTNYIEKFNRLGKINNPEMITDLTLKKERNDLIILNVKKMLTENRKILIISDRRGHCEYLLNALKELNISCGLYLGGMKTTDREISVNCSVIIGTYQASGEGFDVPELDTLILASPKSNVEQAIGRILRQKNKNEPIVLDIVDSFSIFKGQYYKRRKFYKISGFVII